MVANLLQGEFVAEFHVTGLGLERSSSPLAIHSVQEALSVCLSVKKVLSVGSASRHT